MAGYDPAEGDFDIPASNGVTDFINNSANLPKEVGQAVASTIVEKLVEKRLAAGGAAHAGLKGSLLGALVQPAVWIVGGKMPQPGDIQLWMGSTVVSAFGGLGGSLATLAVGVLKAAAEDQEDEEIAAAAAWEPARYRPFIRSARNYGTAARGIVAMTIASHGGVCWRVGRSNWCYVTDALGRLVCDYRPAFAYEVYRPVLPLRLAKVEAGRAHFTWRMGPGTHNESG